MNVLRLRRLVLVFVAAACCSVASAGRAEAQLGALVSPGKLAAAHASLEGLSNCTKCHGQGQKVSPQKCLACHAPIADRIARKTGVHKDAGGDCVICHADHAGVDGQLKPFDQRGFNHTTNTSFPLTGKHAPLALQCAACHKTPSFLTASTSCTSCHADIHKGSLGNTCENCHSVQAAFKDARSTFDHAKAAFSLSGAHKAVACASCHVKETFKGVKFAMCTDCHRDPHKASFGNTCTSCHSNENWRTRTVTHAKTAFALEGKHATVDCVACHKQPAMKTRVRFDTCAACHTDVHKGTFKQDCGACHTTTSFGKAPFDHSQTKFQLTGAHQPLTCVKCHTGGGAAPTPAVTATVTRLGIPRGAAAAPVVTDFKGLSTTCASCHTDVHRGELGATCETCHSSTTFALPKYAHQRQLDLFGGQHATLVCEKCHVPEPLTAPVRTGASTFRVSFKKASTACVSCHLDVHLGQEGTDCQTCHSLDRAKFAIPGFLHPAQSFALTGKHTAVVCAQCHKRETGPFPSGTGSAVRFKGVGRECVSCHADVHLGQLNTRCESCHSSASFKVANYQHTSKTTGGFFTGKHVSTVCANCHTPQTGQFPAAIGTAVRFTTGTACVSCHVDKHRGALGPNCGGCHRP